MGSVAGNRMTSTATLVTGVGKIAAVTITPTADDATVVIYDNTSAAGTIIFHGEADFSVTQETKHFPFIPAIRFETGCHVVITGTTPEVFVYIDQS